MIRCSFVCDWIVVSLEATDGVGVEGVVVCGLCAWLRLWLV